MTARREGLMAVALLLALAAQLGLGLFADGLAGDEVMYIAAGHRHLLADDYAINTEQPPLAKMVAALPLAPLHLREPPRTGDPWEWAFRFIEVENDPARVIAWARLPIVLLTLGLAVLVWRWTRTALGPVAGLIALTLAAFHPSLLAHGHLVTTDAPGALALFAVSAAYARWSGRPNAARAMLTAAAFGLAVATRLTCWILVPAVGLLEALTIVSMAPPLRVRRVRAAVVLAALGAAAAVLVIWAAYGFRYAPFPGESVAYPPGPELGVAGRVIALGLHAHLLPEAYLEGARFVLQHNVAGHPTYLLGTTYAEAGPWYYYAVAFGVKNTPGFLAAAAVGLARLFRRRVWSTPGIDVQLLVPAALTFAAASAGRIQIGERYVLAVYPYLIAMAAAGLASWTSTRRGRLALGAVLALHLGPVLLQAPRGYIPYFNLLAGGTDGGHRVLADSNLDWGQDLPRLAHWMKAHGVGEIQLAYHGPDDPDRFGIRHTDLPGLQHYPPHAPSQPFMGTVAVSPNLLLGVFAEPGNDPYEPLRRRLPDDRAGCYFIFRFER
jgi:hypothetical protein